MSIDKFVQDGQDQKVIEKIYGKIADLLTQGEVLHYIALQKKPAVTLLPDSITISNKRIFLGEFTKLGLSTNFEIFIWKDIKDITFKEEIFGSKVTVIPLTGENLSIDYIPKVQARKLYQLIKQNLDGSKEPSSIPKSSPIVATSSIATVAALPDSSPITSNTTLDVEKPKSLNQQYAEQAKIQSSFEVKSQIPTASSGSSFIDPFQKDPKVIVEQDKVEIKSSFIPPTPIAVPVSTPTPAKEEQEDELTIKLKKLKTLYEKQLITQAEYESKKAEILSQL